MEAADGSKVERSDTGSTARRLISQRTATGRRRQQQTGGDKRVWVDGCLKGAYMMI
jgi:hypothetical protein